MLAPYVQVFKLATQIAGSIEIASVVMDQEDFDKFCNDLEACGLTGVTQEAIDGIRRAKYLPMMKRGTKTQQFFRQFNIEIDYLSAIVRGHGPVLLDQIIASNNPERN